MANHNEKVTAYKSLRDISLRKEELLGEIRKDQKEMGGLWGEMFRPERKGKKKGFSLQGVMNTGIGVLDGALFAWKIYRKFKH